MNRPLIAPAPPTRGWRLYFAAMTAAVALLMGAAVVGIFTDRAQNAERDRVTAALYACFDSYADMNASSSKAVRVASVKVTDATTLETSLSAARNRALQRLFDFTQLPLGEQTDALAERVFSRLSSANSELVAAQDALVEAQDVLAQARKDNPVPDPPSSFCEVSP